MASTFTVSFSSSTSSSATFSYSYGGATAPPVDIYASGTGAPGSPVASSTGGSASGKTFTVSGLSPSTAYSWTFNAADQAAPIGPNRAVSFSTAAAPTATIVFNANSGSGSMSNQTVSANTSTALNYNSFSRSGYDFSQWNTAATGLGTSYANGQSVSLSSGSTLTLYAQWSAANFGVTINPANGSSTYSLGTYQADITSVTAPAAPSYSGYTFNYWVRSDTGGSVSAGGSFTMPHQAITLTASWTAIPVTYSVTYSGNGNTSGTVPTDSTAYSSNATVTAASAGTLAKTGYTFGGWTRSDTSATIAAGSTFSITQNTTLTAIWNINTYTVSYSANGGSGTVPSNQTKTYGIGLTLSNGSTLSKSGYTLTGWSDGTNTYSLGGTYSVNSAATMTAVWTVNTYTVTFDSQGGSSVTSGSFTTGGTVSAPASPTRSGYTFGGWSTTTGGAAINFPYSPGVTQNITLYALWTANTYTLTYDANGGSVSPSIKTVTYGSAYGTLPTPTYIGHTFTGWWTAASGGTQVLSSTTYLISASSTLYAQWTTDAYTVTWNANGGAVSPTATSASYGSSITTPTPTRSGYSFTGWFDSASGGSLIANAGGTYTVLSAITLYAQWTILTPQIYTGSSWQRATAVKVWDGTKWADGQMKIWNGTSWVNPL